MRFRPSHTVAALGAVAVLSTGAVVAGTAAYADGRSTAGADVISVQDTAPTSTPTPRPTRDCPEKDGGAGTGSSATDGSGTTTAPVAVRL